MTKQMPLVSLILLLGTALLISACGSAVEEPVAQAAPPPEAEEIKVPVEVATIETGDVTVTYAYPGSLQSSQDVNVVSGAAGRIESVLVEVGDEVKAGDPIALVERDSYAAQFKQAEAALRTAALNLGKMQLGSRPEEITAAQAAVELARAALDDEATVDDNERTTAATALARAEAALRAAQAEYDKIAWAGDVGETPQAIALEEATIAYETALADYNLDTNPSDSELVPLMLQLAQAELNLALKVEPYREIDFELARVNVAQAEAALEQARLLLEETVIEAPFDGIIAELHIDQGSAVGGQTPVALFVSKEVEAVVNVEEGRIHQIETGQPVALRVSAYPDQDFPGVVTSIAPVADKETRTFEVKATPIDGEGMLRSGMFANLSILAEEKKGVLLAPREAIAFLDDIEIVYVVKGDAVEERPVTSGVSTGDRVEILSGVAAGDVVVIAGQSNLIDGAKVDIVGEIIDSEAQR